ncbi:MAG: hydrolase [Burkholderiales bacterium PBB6]|nr:MAG: hydrolase [Burkholderiales bacterium PBB6]
MNWKHASAASAAALAAVVAFITGCGGQDDRTADTVLRNGVVATMDANDSLQQAVALRDGKIVYVGTNTGVAPYITSSTKVIDLGGRMLMPGFIDAHLHSLAGGRALLVCDLAYAPLSHVQLVGKLQACLDASPGGEPDAWLEAVNWDRQATSGLDGDPTKVLLDGLKTSRPIAITSSDFHAVLGNSRALALGGITKATPDPAGGSFLRDATGAPNGMCIDAAGFELKAAIPPDSDADLLKQGRAALAALREQGITSFMDAAAGESHGKTFLALQKAGELTARVNLAINMSPDAAAADPVKAVADAKTLGNTFDQGTPGVSPGVRARVLKLFIDGVVNAPADNGALLSPYFTNAGTEAAPNWVPGTNLGVVYYPPEVLKPLLLAAADAGLDVHAHATGDRAVRQTLDAVAHVRTQRPASNFRPSIAHAETVAVADYPRFAALDVMATMSHQWAQRASYSIGDTQNHLGPERFARMEPSGSLRLAGARVVHGSDWPIDPFDTFLALKVGVTRSGDPTNPHSAASLSPVFEGRINADPGLSRADVLHGITRNAARQLRLDDVVGSIEVGKFADLIVLERNFLQVPEEELGRNKVLLTMVGGKAVMAKDAFAGLVATAQAATNRRAQVLSLNGSTGHSIPAALKGAPHGDGHRH